MEIVQKNTSNLLIVIGTVLAAVLFGATYAVFANTTSALLPISEGTYTQWSPKTGSTHYTMVDESSCNGTTDYNSTNTVGNRDSYGINISSIPSGATITAIEITPCASKNKSGGASSVMNVFYRWDGTNSGDVGGYALSGTTPTSLTPISFSSLSLVKASSSVLEIGAVLSIGTKGARVSRIATVVTYTPAPPTVTTDSATSVASISATLHGTGNPNGTSTTGWFRYSTTNPGTCDDIFGTRAPASGGTNLGSSTSPVNYSRIVTGLSPATTYYYCAVASNSGGLGFGNVVSFITVAPPTDPSNLEASVGTSTGTTTPVTLTWVDNSNDESGFSVQRSTDGTNFFNVFFLSQNTETHIDNVPNSSTFYYRIRAYNSGGSSYSNSVMVVVL